MSPCAHRKQTFCFPRCRLVAVYNALNSASCRSVKNLLESSPRGEPSTARLSPLNHVDNCIAYAKAQLGSSLLKRRN